MIRKLWEKSKDDLLEVATFILIYIVGGVALIWLNGLLSFSLANWVFSSRSFDYIMGATIVLFILIWLLSMLGLYYYSLYKVIKQEEFRARFHKK
jgi:hypothetical protein